MRAKQKTGFRAAAESRDQIYKLDFSPRRFVSERLFRHTPTGRLELLFDISARPHDRVRARRPWSEIDKRLDVSQCFVAGKFVPDLFRNRFGARGSHRSANEGQSGARKSTRHSNVVQRSLELNPTMFKIRWRSSSPKYSISMRPRFGVWWMVTFVPKCWRSLSCKSAIAAELTTIWFVRRRRFQPPR